ncbi:unnamed protein product [Arabis nemorensis]|uniref:Uncharacterized protein n=1 Tax=Arabis nemorensis TaxID=586526 RepID=A0A565BUU4_9BRAS|nr:unnamed protein product [Arabis nemorensis]
MDDYGDQLTDYVLDMEKGSVEKGKGKLLGGEDTGSSQAATEVSLNSLLLSYELHGSSEDKTHQDEAPNISLITQRGYSERSGREDPAHIGTAMIDWGPKPKDVAGVTADSN